MKSALFEYVIPMISPTLQNWTLVGHCLRGLAAGVSCLALSMGGTAAIAQTSTDTSDVADRAAQSQQFLEALTDIPSSYEIDAEFESERDDAWPTVTEEDTSLFGMTQPSLWWSRDQLPNRWRSADQSTLQIANYRLVRGWTAFHSQSTDAFIVDVQVDPQYWNRLNYVQQYSVLNQFGTTGISYGYHVRIYNATDLAAVHACDFSGIPELSTPPVTPIPIPDLPAMDCSAEVGPFIDFSDTLIEEDLFAPP